jgi:hypothetical protein
MDFFFPGFAFSDQQWVRRHHHDVVDRPKEMMHFVRNHTNVTAVDYSFVFLLK